MNKVTFSDLFSGAGLFSAAFAQAGFKAVEAIELCPVASETYRRNLGKHIRTGDVSMMDPIGKCDLLVGGPPCQGFSTLGNRNQLDPRNKLSLQMARWAKKCDAKVVVVENVGAFLESVHWKHLAKALRAQGFEVETFLVNAADCGVPQLRERSFTIASKIGRVSLNLSKKRWRTVRQAFRGLPKINRTDCLHRSRKISSLSLDRIRTIPEGGGKKEIMSLAPHLAPPSWWKIPNQATDVWGRMHWDSPCNTLRTAMINPSKGRYVHPSENRVITLREAARLHSIPDTWEFFGNDSAIARQIGNSVPPLLGLAIAEAVKRLFNDLPSQVS